MIYKASIILSTSICISIKFSPLQLPSRLLSLGDYVRCTDISIVTPGIPNISRIKVNWILMGNQQLLVVQSTRHYGPLSHPFGLYIVQSGIICRTRSIVLYPQIPTLNIAQANPNDSIDNATTSLKKRQDTSTLKPARPWIQLSLGRTQFNIHLIICTSPL